MKTTIHSTRILSASLLALALSVFSSSNAQFKRNYEPGNDETLGLHQFEPVRDSKDNLPSSKGRYWVAAAEAGGSNIAVWAFFRYAEKEPYTYISLNSIREHFKTGFWWDEDQFFGNQFNHPYHGSMYYNSARSNGIGFWESAAYALSGSAMWELFMEVEPPSYNDIVNTPVSGIILGEISYRTTSLILDDSRRGLDRVLRETASFLINPMRGFNRIVHGDMWHSGPAPTRADHTVSLSLGGHNVFFDRTLTHNHGYGLARFEMDYGNLFATSEHIEPFDYFNVHAEIGLSGNDLILGIVGSGVLWDRNVTLFDNGSSVLGLYKEFDLMGNLVYHLTATSVTARVTTMATLPTMGSLVSSLGISAVLMGGVNSQYAEVYDRRYNIGPGASGSASAILKIPGYGNVSLNYKRFWLHTLNGADSNEFVGLFRAGTEFVVARAASVGVEILLYERYGRYNRLPDISNAHAAGRVFAKFIVS